MQNYSSYTEGRGTYSTNGSTYLSERERRAVAKNTAFGKSIGTNSWTTHEYSTLVRLEEIGVRAPQAIDRSANVILMEYFGDHIRGAPTLIEKRLDANTAQKLCDECLYFIELMLEDFIIHGDLSPYNILHWNEAPIIIDVPQVIDPMVNPNAYDFFERDVKRVCDYFAHNGVTIESKKVTYQLWNKYIESQV